MSADISQVTTMSVENECELISKKDKLFYFKNQYLHAPFVNMQNPDEGLLNFEKLSCHDCQLLIFQDNLEHVKA